MLNQHDDKNCASNVQGSVFPTYDYLQAWLLKEIKVSQNVSSKVLKVLKFASTPEGSSSPPRMPWLSHLNHHYFELQRPLPNDLPIFMACLAVMVFLIILVMVFSIQVHRPMEENIFTFLCVIFLIFYPLAWLVRYSFFTPHALPVRFNRKRQKVYFYQRQVTANPWGTWPVSIEAMDWENVLACEVRVTAYRNTYHAIHCLNVCARYQVIVHHEQLFSISPSSGWKGSCYLESLWTWCQHYMSGNIACPADKNKPGVILGNTRRIAWPQESDRESRSE